MTTIERPLDPAFQQQLAQWNRSHPSHPPTLVWYNPKSVKAGWTQWIEGVPINRWKYLARWEVGVLLPAPLPGLRRLTPLGPRRWFLKLFTWCRKDAQGRDTGFANPDARIFTLLRLSDTTQESHYAALEANERAKQEAVVKEHRELAMAGARQYRGWDSPIVPVKPTTPLPAHVKADWRHRTR